MQFPSLLHDYLDLSARRFPEKDYLIHENSRCSYRQVQLQSLHLARGLVELGLSPQDRVAVFMDNTPEAVVSLFAISRAAGTFVLINNTVKWAKLRYILGNSRAKILIAHHSKAQTVQQALDGMETSPTLIWVDPDGEVEAHHNLPPGSVSWNALLKEWQTDLTGVSFPRAIDQDLAALIYTSGSSGQPKGVMQPHFRMIGVAQSIIHYLENTPEDVILNILPLAFGYGLYQVLTAVLFGGTVLLEKSFIYLGDILGRISLHRVTGFPVVPTVLAMLFGLEEINDFDFSSLRYITSAGSALPAAYIRKLRTAWPHIKLYPMYGLTECVRVCYLEPEWVDQRPDSVGFEIPNCKAFIVDEEGATVGFDRVGELVVTGRNVMSGYWGDPELTARVFRPGPLAGEIHLYTGDLFRRDRQGFLYFVGRKDDQIKSRGERVCPLEVENILLQMEDILEVAVIGVPDEILGQAVKAFIVPRPGSAITEHEVLKYCTLNMENFMIPGYIVFVKELPKNPNGKVDKGALRDDKERVL